MTSLAEKLAHQFNATDASKGFKILCFDAFKSSDDKKVSKDVYITNSDK